MNKCKLCNKTHAIAGDYGPVCREKVVNTILTQEFNETNELDLPIGEIEIKNIDELFKDALYFKEFTYENDIPETLDFTGSYVATGNKQIMSHTLMNEPIFQNAIIKTEKDYGAKICNHEKLYHELFLSKSVPSFVREFLLSENVKSIGCSTISKKSQDEGYIGKLFLSKGGKVEDMVFVIDLAKTNDLIYINDMSIGILRKERKGHNIFMFIQTPSDTDEEYFKTDVLPNDIKILASRKKDSESFWGAEEYHSYCHVVETIDRVLNKQRSLKYTNIGYTTSLFMSERYKEKRDMIQREIDQIPASWSVEQARAKLHERFQILVNEKGVNRELMEINPLVKAMFTRKELDDMFY